jgi:hypothetical protein
MAWSSTLAVAVDDKQNDLRVAAPMTSLPSSNYVVIEDEIVAIHGAGSEGALIVSRGMMGTTPMPHAAGATVTRYAVATTAAGPHTHDYAATVHTHAAGTAAHDHDGVYATPHAHPYATDDHAHAGGAHPDLATHETLGLAPAVHGHVHNHDGTYAAPHAHPYSSDAHAHAGVYEPVHAHPYAATAHAHVLTEPDIPAAIARDTEVTSAISTHAAAVDPHPGYLTAAEGNAAYAAAVHQHAGGGANVKSGVVNVTAGGSAVVTFVTPFAATPQVIVTNQFASADTSTTLSVFPVSTTGFTIRGAGNAAGTVAWIATDAGNP